VLSALILAQLTIATSAPDTVRWRDKIPVRVVVQAPGREAPRVLAPSLRGLSIAGTYEESRLEIRNGVPWVSVERRYELAARRPGDYIVGAFEARLHGERVQSRPLTVTVVATGDTVPPAVVTRARIDPRAHVNFRAMVLPETVYVGQQASYQVGVFLDDQVRMRLRRNPEFIPPEPRSMMVYELRPRALELPSRTEGGVRYETHAFERALFPLSAGRYVIPPAELVYSLPLSSSFFSRSETFSMRAESLAVVALEPPEAGRPSDYAGAVGSIAIAAAADSARARVGDPLVLTLSVSGVGNVKLFPRPNLQLSWGTTVPGGERVTIDSTASLVRGTKEFDWIVTPRQAGRVPLEPVRYPYFNPYTERYELAVTGPDTLDIAPGSLVRTDTAVVAAAPLSISGRDEGPVAPPPDRSPIYWLIAGLAPLPALASLVFTRRRRTRPARRDPAVVLRACAGRRLGRRSRDVAALRRAFVDAVAVRAALGAAAFTHSGELARALRRAGATPEVADGAERLLRELDAAVFADGAVPDDAHRRALDLYRRLDRETRARTAAPSAPARRLLSLLLCATLSASAAGAQESDFTRGVAAYQRAQYAEARGWFEDYAIEHPQSFDAWANFGTAAWSAGDTTHAVLGWQRAQRLRPLATDIGERLERVPGAHGGDVSGVIPVPSALPATVAIALWVGAWLLLAWRSPQRAGWPRAAGALALVSSLAVLLAGRLIERQHAGSDLAVIAEPGPLRSLPALAAEPRVIAARGEMARIEERQGVWRRVRLDGGRSGWMEAQRLLTLHVAGEHAPESSR
jgi:hypothetical protein